MFLRKLFTSRMRSLLSAQKMNQFSWNPNESFLLKIGIIGFPKSFTSESKGGEDKDCIGGSCHRHGYPDELEAAVNQQILLELGASMVYLSMFCYYGRTDIALPGCQSFFRSMYNEEQTHAFEFMEYQLMRGGKVHLYPTTAPEDHDWIDITVALGVALELEKRVKEKLEALVALAECNKDLQFADFVTSRFLEEQNKSICELGRLLTSAKRLVDTGGVGRYLFDKQVLEYVRGRKDPEVKLPYGNI